ncbi:alpha-1,3/1,6-mannosyltransferase ALG2 [Chrysoperla carnea]|uniref:alpha-1,3/1,6-mannosyltransferase ALG2 n=1 Tax=Chrysoperla carnea TaxID=189513 RepID=UPI001D08E7FA|nr:alpha-1,3/1,6-mannosyltransferase ALG2 [Chrysoperla carnea]
MAKVIFIHPDLGIGGAERLVVDAALALHENNYQVKFVTNHHDPSHCFSETKDGTFDIKVVADWFPRSIFGKCVALCAYFRFILAAFHIILFDKTADIIFVDSISVVIPILRLFTKSKIIYYCHYPDMLLSQPGGTLKQIYRMPLNLMEEYSIYWAHKTLVNSYFTSSVFKNTFRSLWDLNIEVLYPSINTSNFDLFKVVPIQDICHDIPRNAIIFLSINRYERKKNILLAIEAFVELKDMLSTQEFEPIYLIIAGGYDSRVSENVEYFQELVKAAENMNILNKVRFLKSPTDMQKVSLLKQCNCLLYTPSNEHFGIVPLEAMYAGKPVIACNSGGPTETVIDQITGFLSDANSGKFANNMSRIVLNTEIADRIGTNGRHRFDEKFSFSAFQSKLIGIVSELHPITYN